MFGGIFWLIGIVSAVWVISDVFTKQKKMEESHKILWTVAAVIFSVVTAVVYYLVVKRK